MRKLLIIKKQNEFDKKLENDEKGFSIFEHYSLFNEKDKEVILNDKKILKKAFKQLRIKENNSFWNDFRSYYSPFNLSGNNLTVHAVENFNKDIYEAYIDFLFELKSIVKFKIDMNLFKNISSYENIVYLANKYKIGNKLIKEIEKLESIQKIIKYQKLNGFLDFKENELELINHSIMRYLSRIEFFKSNFIKIDIKKKFTIERISNF